MGQRKDRVALTASVFLWMATCFSPSSILPKIFGVHLNGAFYDWLRAVVVVAAAWAVLRSYLARQGGLALGALGVLCLYQPFYPIPIRLSADSWMVVNLFTAAGAIYWAAEDHNPVRWPPRWWRLRLMRRRRRLREQQTPTRRAKIHQIVASLEEILHPSDLAPLLKSHGFSAGAALVRRDYAALSFLAHSERLADPDEWEEEPSKER